MNVPRNQISVELPTGGFAEHAAVPLLFGMSRVNSIEQQ
jgi:hypothetical protein